MASHSDPLVSSLSDSRGRSLCSPSLRPVFPSSSLSGWRWSKLWMTLTENLPGGRPCAPLCLMINGHWENIGRAFFSYHVCTRASPAAEVWTIASLRNERRSSLPLMLGPYQSCSFCRGVRRMNFGQWILANEFWIGLKGEFRFWYWNWARDCHFGKPGQGELFNLAPEFGCMQFSCVKCSFKWKLFGIDHGDWLICQFICETLASSFDKTNRVWCEIFSFRDNREKLSL